MQPNDKQKRFLFIVIGILAILYFAPRIIGMYQQHRALEAFAHRKPSAAIIAAPIATTAPAAVATSTIPPVAMGRYAGAGVVIPRQCKVDLEVRPAQGDAYAGYLTVMCFVPPHLTGGKPPFKNPILEAASQMTPASAIMTGTVENGDLVFTVDRTIGKLGDGCSLTGTFKVSTFGMGKVLVQWQEGECEGGQLLLQHISI